MLKVFFRVDANNKIGTGHFHRCLTLSKYLSKINIYSIFLVNSLANSFYDKILKEGFSYEVLPEQKGETANLIISTINSFCESDDALLVIDSDRTVFYTPEFQKHIKTAGIYLMMITFNSDYHYFADIVHNQSILALDQKYSVESYTKLLMGPKYTVLSEEYKHYAKKIKSTPREVKKILITFGGLDKYNQSQKAIMALNELVIPFERLIIVLGPMYSYITKLRDTIKSTGLRAELHINTKKMPELMSEVDLAISSGGLTVWELACLGVPNIIVSTSEREMLNSQKLFEKGGCYYLGHHDRVSVNDISTAINLINNDRVLRISMAYTATFIVDGGGGQRVVEHIIDMAQKPFNMN